MTPRRRQRGYLLISVVVTLFLLAAVAVLLNQGSAISASTAGSELESSRADYVAEAGIQHALWAVSNSACRGDLTIPETTLGSDRYTATVTGAASGAPVTLNVDQDAWIRNDDPDKNNNSDDGHIRFEGGKIEHALTRFDLSGLPADAQINSAVAWFYVKDSNGQHAEGSLTVHRVTSDWTETGATWNTVGGNFESGAIASIPPQETAGSWVSFNLTGQVQAWVNGQPNFGILMASTAEGVHAKYDSSEAGNPPRLEVVVGSGAASPVLIQAKAMLANGNGRLLTRPNTVALQPPGTVVLQPDEANSEDAYIWDWYQNSNYGTDDEAWVCNDISSGECASLFRFNADQVPRGSRILSATLSLHHKSGSGATIPVSARRVMRSWNEASVTWRTRDGGTDWNDRGGDFDGTAVATTDVGPATDRRYEWDITQLVQGWSDGSYPNYGVALTSAMGGSSGETFHSSADTEPTRRPRLTISYACECGTPCMGLQGAGRIALIGDDNSPDSDDERKIALFESWGYDVDFYEDRASDSINWDTYDLAYISETVIASDVSANLANLSIGVVNEERRLYDDLSMASDSTERVGSSIDLVDTGHYITAVFQKGPLPIYTGAMQIVTADTPLATDLQILATLDGAATLTAIDQGAKTTSGIAAGRRVNLPLGQHFDADFDWANLNRNGLLLVQRAIVWAMYTEPGIGDVLMVVVDDNTLTDQELAKRTLLESWGYTVNVIDEDESQSVFDAAFSDNDVVFVGEDVVASDVNTKLTDATIGVVIEEANLVDDLGMGDGIAWDSGNKISVINNGHYITYPFAAGSLSILDSNESLAYQTPDPAPDLKLLGSSGSGPGLTALEAGAELVTGGPAAGRRVLLPWGGDRMDVNSLNDNGRLIFQRAIEWGAGAELPGPIAHWKLDETSGVTADDSVGDYDGTLANGPLWADGVVGGALDFDGVDDRAGTGPGLDDLFSGTATITAWIRPRGWGGGNFGRILDKADNLGSNRNGWALELYGAQQAILFQYGFSGSIGNWYTPNGSVTLDDWQHVALVFDNSSDANDPKIYVDGVLQSLVELDAPSGTASSDVGIELTIGNYALNNSRAFDGLLDDIRIYDRELASSEIAELATRPPITPIAHWTLDEGSGPSAVDVIGGRVGTLTNGAAWAAGTLDSAVRFDGSNDRINVPHDNGLNLVSQMTLSAWIYADALKPFQMVLTKGDNGVAENYWLATQGDKLNFGFIDGGLYAQYTSSTLTLQSGTWHHVAATFDDAADEVVLYVDGSSETFSSTYTPAANTERLIIGSSYYGGEAFDGVLDDVRIYNRVLGSGEIVALAAAGGGGGGGGPGAGCSGTFRDEFNSRVYSNSDGTLSWATDWQETGESTSPTGGDIRIDDDFNNYQLQVRDDGQTVMREADLSEAGSATLSFEYRRQGLSGSSDYVAVDVSYNGGSNWTELARFTGTATDSNYLPYSQPLDSNFLSANTRIRFRTPGSGMNNDTMVWFDNVQIACTP